MVMIEEVTITSSSRDFIGVNLERRLTHRAARNTNMQAIIILFAGYNECDRASKMSVRKRDKPNERTY